MYVLDATPLIYLAKAGQLAALAELDRQCVVPEAVYDEVVTVGVEEGHSDARVVERAIEDGVLDVRSVTDTTRRSRLQRFENLSEADVAVLALAAAKGAAAVMDERYGRSVAAAEDVPTRGTAFLVLRLLSIGVIDPDEARETIDRMVNAGWYCAPNVYATIRRRIDEID